MSLKQMLAQRKQAKAQRKAYQGGVPGRIAVGLGSELIPTLEALIPKHLAALREKPRDREDLDSLGKLLALARFVATVVSRTAATSDELRGQWVAVMIAIEAWRALERSWLLNRVVLMGPEQQQALEVGMEACLGILDRATERTTVECWKYLSVEQNVRVMLGFDPKTGQPDPADGSYERLAHGEIY